MFIDVFLTAGLALAQPPAAAPAPFVIPQPVIAADRLMPAEQPPAPVAPMTQPVPVAAAPCDGCTDAAAGPPKYFAERLLEGTRFGDILTNRGIKVSGWVQSSWNYGNANESNLPLQFIDRAHEFLINQVNLRVEKPIDTEKKEFQLGFFADTIIGTDARFTLSRGLFDGQVTQDGDLYPIDPFQRYAIAYLPGIGQGTTVKIGRFATHCSYETIDPTTVPFITRAYTFMYNPYTHTGVHASTQLSDAVSVQYGVATGSDVFIDPAAWLTFIGGFRIAPKDGDSALQFNTVVTNPKFNVAESFNNYNVYNVVYTRKLNDRWSYAADMSASHEYNVPGTTGASWWYGAANYLSYKISDCLIANGRAEVWRDDKGVRTGTASTYYDVTLGFQWRPTEAIQFTPEVRYDHGTNGPFENGRKDLFVGAVSMIVRW